MSVGGGKKEKNGERCLDAKKAREELESPEQRREEDELPLTERDEQRDGISRGISDR